MRSPHPLTGIHRSRDRALIAVLGAGVLLGIAASAWTASGDAAPADRTSSPPARFDLAVRNDFFAGFAGDQAALDRAMKFCEEALAKDPKNAEARVWHGGGVMMLASRDFNKGETQKGIEKYQRSLQEMADAVKLEPDNPGVLIPRGAVLIPTSRYTPDPKQKEALLKDAMADYEKVYAVQKPYFDKLGTHPRGELLFGLAEGWRRLGDEKKAQAYLEQIVQTCKGSPYETEAKQWLQKPATPESPTYHNCTGCHVP